MTVVASFLLPPKDSFGNVQPMPNPFVASVQTEIGAQYSVAAPSGSGTITVYAPGGTSIGSGTAVSFTATVSQAIVVVAAPVAGYVTVTLNAPPATDVPDPLTLGSLITKTQPVANVLAYGADPSGATDSTAAIQSAAQALPDGAGTVLLPPGRFVCNNAILQAPYGTEGTLRIRGAGRDTTTLVATEAVNSTLTVQGNSDISDLTVDGGGVAATALAQVAPSGTQGARIASRRIRTRNIAADSAAWVYVVWGQGTLNVAFVSLDDISIEGPSSENTDAFTVAGAELCMASKLRFSGVYRTPNFYTIGTLVAHQISITDMLGSPAALVIDADVTRALVSELTTDDTVSLVSNCSRLHLSNSDIFNLTLSEYGTENNVSLDNTSVRGQLQLEGPVGSLKMVGGSLQGNYGAVAPVGDYTAAGTVHGPIRLVGVELGNANVIESYNGTGAPTHITACQGFSPGRSVLDGALTKGSNILASDTANFGSGDVGRAVSDEAGSSAIPAGTTIASITSSTEAVLSADATADATEDTVALGGLAITGLGTYKWTFEPGSRISDASGSGWTLAGTALVTPSVPAASTTVTNTEPVDVDIYVTGFTAASVSINGTATGLGSGTFFVPAGGTINLGAYTAAGTWKWVGR